MIHRLAIRVYYEDTDFSGAVYHANYLRYFERGRTEFLRACGVNQLAAFESVEPDRAFVFMVRSMTVDWLKPARMDDLVTVETQVERLGPAALELAQRLLREDQVLTNATVRVACVIKGRAARIPSWVREKLEL